MDYWIQLASDLYCWGLPLVIMPRTRALHCSRGGPGPCGTVWSGRRHLVPPAADAIIKQVNFPAGVFINEGKKKMIDKRKLKEQYKQTVLPMGVYQIKNLANGKILVGSSKNLPGKINSHRFQLKMGSHMNRALQEEYTCFGEEKFTFEVLDNLEPKEDPLYDYSIDLDTLEKMWIERLQPFGERGYHKKIDESL